MNKKDNKEYTTLQIRKDINKHIKTLCKRHGLIASTVTEQLWTNFISASMSGSVTL